MADQTQPQVVFLGEGSKRTKGRDAQRINILIAKAVANAVRSTLGPKGMDKMLVDELGDVTISNDGATILTEMSIEHPVGKMMVEVAKTQDEEAGDGTTTAVVLAGGLLQNAERLLDDEIHASTIVNGYRLAAKKATEFYKQAAESVSFDDVKTLKDIAITSMTGKATESCEELSGLIVNSIRQVAEKEDGKMVIDLDNVKVEKKVGGSLSDSVMVQGIVIDKEIVHPQMPKRVKNAKIALLDCALEIKSTETETKIQIDDPSKLQGFLDQEEAMLRKMVDTVKASGANVVICQKGIDDLVQHFLAKAGIAAVRRVKQSDMEGLTRATGAKLVTRLQDISKEDLGFAAEVCEKKISGDDMVFVEGCKNPKAVSILVRGGSEHVVDEAERAVHDALGAVASTVRDGKIVIGGGSVEVEVAMKLREYAKSVGGREQLAIEAFADTLEIIPRTLAETAGMDPLDTIVALRSKHNGKEGKYIGVNVFEGKIDNMKNHKVVEPLRVKTQAISSGSEVAEMILRIDDIIAGSSKGGAGRMPPGMGGHGDMEM